MNYKKAIVSWSGGIDSTALLGHLLKAGYDVTTFYLEFYGLSFTTRELNAREFFKSQLGCGLARFDSDGQWRGDEIRDGSFLWQFSPDGIEIPMRNRLIIDYMVAQFGEYYVLGLGEYIGADSWVVQDHVPGNDADVRSLTGYLHYNYGLKHRLMTLADFGESRFKTDRVRLLRDELGQFSFMTTNCMADNEVHCGICYKCIERHVAMYSVFGYDATEYEANPEHQPQFQQYKEQMGATWPSRRPDEKTQE